ncbi:MAG: hypothetical protein R3277_05500 [Brumimicrobium sp.]|nr:hypothetical protein [Brumimicrobium sp.]
MEKEKEITQLLEEKALMKQDVYSRTFETFNTFKEVIQEALEEFREKIPNERVRLKYEENGDFESLAYVGSDVLVFNMHTNIFSFPKENAVWKTSYIQNDDSRVYCGIINIYNFLADSFLHNRLNDAGYLIGRIFVNKENHFIVEGKGQLGFLFRDFLNGQLTKEEMHKILCVAIRHSVEFDLLTPPYEKVNIVNVMQIKAVSSAQQMKTGKRLGFRFEYED